MNKTMNSDSKHKPAVILPDDSKPAEVVIDLDSYEEASKNKRKRVTSNRCVNFECESGEAFRRATIFCLNYYRVKVKPNKVQEVCAECYEASIKYYERLTCALKNSEFLIEQEFPVRDDFVEIDSDEEVSVSDVEQSPECEITKDAQDFIAEHIPSVMNEVLNDYNIEIQSCRAIEHVEERQNRLGGALADLDEVQRALQRDIDRIRRQLYAEFQPSIMKMPSIEIVDPFANYLNATGAKTPIPLSPTTAALTALGGPPRREAERRSHRNITKPASYCELTDDIDQTQSSTPLQEQSALTSSPPPLLATPAAQTVALQSSSSLSAHLLPPKGPLQRPRPSIGDTYYAMRQSVFGAWGRVRLLEITTDEQNHAHNYRVKFEGKAKGLSSPKIVTGKQLAYANPSPVRLEVGTRVIAVFFDETTAKKESFFTGCVAEPLNPVNQFRYLVFFDDGYAQYVRHEKVLVVVEASRNIWDDVHPESRNFIRKYLEIYPERPMVKLQPGQVVKTEWNGKWWIARVVRVDGSLVHMYFDADARYEWIYRGSTRLGPLFLEMQAAANRQERGPHIPKIQQSTRKNLPYVEYTRSQNDPSSVGPAVEEPPTEAVPPPRAVARKSTNRPASAAPPAANNNMVPFLPTQQVQQPQSKVVYFTPKSVVAPRPFTPHHCSPVCLDFVTLPLAALKGYNPLSKPLLCGWHRQMCKYKGKKVIRYRAPCGRTLRNMPELHRYLRVTKANMSVDMFDFDFWVHCLAEFVLDKTYRSKRDISNGVEHVPIPCVNYVDNSMPDFTKYSTKREPTEDVNLNLDEEYLCGCDCADDCADKTKCACWQLTIREARTLNRRVPDELIGYTYKRLPEFVTTGIYECNARCRCARGTCLNRVVQHPLQLKLQLFKTANRGWGIRCLNDIPQGAFICIYAGSLLTDKMANEGGVNYGDEYLAELDYIEVVERQKDGYESDVTDIEDNEEEDERKDYQDEDYEVEKDYEEGGEVGTGGGAATVAEPPIRTRLRKRNTEDSSQDSHTDKDKPPEDKEKQPIPDDDTVTISDDDETIREPSRFIPVSDTSMSDQLQLSTAPRFKSVRKMFGDDEVCYIMDAKNTGNIGRFLNHSCSPNVFVQNVFVDTHDLRFPWVAFFAMNYIRAGTELTWNYNYDVGSVPGKVIFCHCGSPDCRGRLL